MVIQQFRLSLNMNFAKIEARQLRAPMIQFGQDPLVKVKNGVWSDDISNEKIMEKLPFLKPAMPDEIKWAILICNQSSERVYANSPEIQRHKVDNLAEMLSRMSRMKRLNLAGAPSFIERCNFEHILQKLNEAKKNEIRILFCIIPDGRLIYGQLKKLAELQIGILSQCIKVTTVLKIYERQSDQTTISNILLKVNAKLNGTNHKVDKSPILNENCRIIGADVSHPSPDQRNIPSVVGVVASHDRNGFCYNATWRIQEPKVEIIEDFEKMIYDHLKFYKNKNGALPDKILYYRDGVSESQFEQVMQNEKLAIGNAYHKIQLNYEKTLKITIVIVQKRHHTRFFPIKDGQNDVGIGRNNNVPPGTIVDKEIVHPKENQFYLVSHAAPQGVARPTKYCIIHDDANHSVDDLQSLTYNLCHLFSRCSRSVSYPAPTYYAHLMAARGRVYGMDEIGRRDTGISDNHPMYFV